MNEMNARLMKLLSKSYSNPGDYDVDDFLYSYGVCIDALLYSSLFTPELIEIDSSVLLKSRVSNKEAIEEFRKSNKEGKSDLSQIESNFNWIEVGSIFANRESSEEEDVLLATKIRDAWEAWLRYLYPNRRFIVRIIPPEETGETIGVGFHEDRNLLSEEANK